MEAIRRDSERRVLGRRLTLAALLIALAPLGSAELSLSIESSRPDFLFTEAETPEVQAIVAGAGGAVALSWEVKETEGSWTANGEFPPAPTGETGRYPLPLELPGRGHYTLALRAESGGEVRTCTTALAVVFTPRPPSANSPWGIFHVPVPERVPEDPFAAKAIAANMRRLGASWARLNFWDQAYEDVRVTADSVTADVSRWKTYARALHGEGIHVMGEIAQCPAALSSRPDDLTSTGDHGPARVRVRPRDYAAWDSLMRWLAAEFRGEISVWEIWNEPGFDPGFWVGTPEEFAELVHHTSAALRAGNPGARIAGCGFVEAQDFADRLFELGVAADLDILTVHYTDAAPSDLASWKELLDKRALDIPIWNTEERAEAPLLNLAQSIAPSFKFLHASIGYEAFRPLVNLDLTPRPPAVWFATAAHCLGTATFVRTIDSVPGYEGFLFRRGEEMVAAFRALPFKNIFGPEYRCGVTLHLETLTSGEAPQLTDRYGRSRPVPAGTSSVVLDSSLMFLHGAKRIEVLKAMAREPEGSRTLVVEAEAGRLGPHWSVVRDARFSGGRFASLWAKEAPGEQPYRIDLDVKLRKSGRYALFFSGNRLTRLAAPRSLSTFTWSMDDGPDHAITEPVDGLPNVTDAGEGLFPIGVADLDAGTHTFTLRIREPRAWPDEYYALWFDALVLHKAEE